jgi:hypothetical protein
MVAFDAIGHYEQLRARLQELENAGQWDSEEALALDHRLVEARHPSVVFTSQTPTASS